MSATLEDRFWSKVDKSGSCWEWTSTIDPKGYGRFSIGTKVKMAHRVAYEMLVQPLESSEIHLDHACRNRACVNPHHLREVSRKQNMENRTGHQSNNKSGFRGVSLHKTSGLWQATVGHNGRQLHLGYFKDPAEAGEVAKAKRLELYTHNEVDKRSAA